MGKDMLLLVGAPLLDAPGVPHADLIVVTYPFNVLFMPTLVPFCLWFKQLQRSTSDAFG